MKKINLKKLPESPAKTLLGLSSFEMLAMFRRGLFYTFISIYLREFLNMSVWETTLVATFPMIMNVLFQNFAWGPLSDKTQKRRSLIIIGEILAGFGTFLIWIIHFNFSNLILAGYIIIIGLSFVEMAWSMSNIGYSALIADLYPFEERSKIMGQLASLGGVGRIFGIFIGGILYDSGFGFRNGPLFFVAVLTMFVSSLPMIFLTPEGGINRRQEEDYNFVELEDANRKSLVIFGIFITALIFIQFGRNSIDIPYAQYLSLETGFDLDSIMISFVANSRSIAVIIIGILTGVSIKKIGDNRTLITGTLIGILALVITATTIYLPLIFIGNFLMGTAEVLIYASSYTIASILMPPKMRAKLFAVYNAAFFLSWGIPGSLITGPLIDFLINNGSGDVFAYQMAFLVGAFMCLIGLLIFIALGIWLKTQKTEIKDNRNNSINKKE